MEIYTPKFIGQEFPPDSRVTFVDKHGYTQQGIVQRLKKKGATVGCKNGAVYTVPYRMLMLISKPKSDMTLSEIEYKACELFDEHGLGSAGWSFGFDLAPSRGGACYFKPNRIITMSISYCLRASKSEIVNTLLHEIAHALVGIKQGHGKVWKAMAQAIGCTAMRCHSVSHTESKYVGRCGCGDGWSFTRDRLTLKSREGVCAKCGNSIEWKLRGLENDSQLNNGDTDDTANTETDTSHLTPAQKAYFAINGML